MDEQKDRGDRGPTDPTRKLLKVFGVKVTDYEAKTDELIARWPAANERDRALIQAEAANRGLGGLTPAQAKTFYDAGVTASIEQWGGTAAAAAAYLTDPNVVYVAGTTGLVRIAQQKWLALYADGGTAWAEWRRTCVPYTISPGANASRANIPRRLQYSTTERSVNGANLTAAIAQQGADAFETRMYWDTNAAAAPTYPTTFTCGLRGSAPAP